MTDQLPRDEVTVTSERSWLSRAGGALKAAVLGLLAVLGAIGLLVWNESRAVTSITALNWAADSLISVSGQNVAPLNEGKLVHVSSLAEAREAVRDPVFRIEGAGILRLVRKVEMLQWQEKRDHRTETGVGGRETTTTTYRYVRDWFEQPVDSSSFHQSAGHENPPMPYRTTSIEPVSARFGAFSLDASQLRRLEASSPLPEDMRAKARLPAGFTWEGDLIYRGADYANPKVGDLRITYSFAPNQPVTVVAAQRGQGFAPFIAPNGYEINLLREGTHDAAAMVSQARDDEVMLTWILRGVGFIVMLVGFQMLNTPLVWLASLLPPLAALVNAASFGLAVLLAVPLTLLTIALSWLAFRPLLALGLIVAGVVAVPLLMRFLKPARPAPRPATPGGRG